MFSFLDRRDAGKKLGKLLEDYKNKDVVVYGLPRGGVVVADEVAQMLKAPLSIVLARKIGHPFQQEYAIAAVSEHGHLVGNTEELRSVDREWFEHEKERQISEIQRRKSLYLGGRDEPAVRGKTALIVDDGIATGLTMMAAVMELKDRHPKELIVAVPCAPKSVADEIRRKCDGVIGLVIAPDYEFAGAVGAYYDYFPQVEDQEVIGCLAGS